MSREVYTLNPYKQVLLREEEYLALAEKANANEEQIKQMAKEMYEQKGTAYLGISLYLQEGGCGREYEKSESATLCCRRQPNLAQSQRKA